MKKILSALLISSVVAISSFSAYAVDFIPGDVTGDLSVNTKDVASLRRSISGWDVNLNLQAGDVDNDSAVDAKDVTLIRRYLASWDVELKISDGLKDDTGDSSGGTTDDNTGDNETSATENQLLITEAGIYTFTGNITDNMITVDAPEQEVTILLNNANISNASGPALYVREAGKVIITCPAGTKNVISDGSSYTVTDGTSTLDGAIFSKANLKIDGEGELVINGNYKHGIVSKDNLTIENGIIEINSQKVALNGKDRVKIDGGNITIDAGSDGIRSDNNADALKGYVEITAGTLNITAGSDGIQAYTYAYIEGGEVTINSTEDGIKTDTSYFQITNGNLNITAGDEAIQGETYVIIEGGSIVADAVGDGIASAIGYVEISGGTVNVTADSDGIQGETDVTITDGIVTIDAVGDGIVSVTGTVNIEGGTVDVIS